MVKIKCVLRCRLPKSIRTQILYISHANVVYHGDHHAYSNKHASFASREVIQNADKCANGGVDFPFLFSTYNVLHPNPIRHRGKSSWQTRNTHQHASLISHPSHIILPHNNHIMLYMLYMLLYVAPSPIGTLIWLSLWLCLLYDMRQFPFHILKLIRYISITFV